MAIGDTKSVRVVGTTGGYTPTQPELLIGILMSNSARITRDNSPAPNANVNNNNQYDFTIRDDEYRSQFVILDERCTLTGVSSSDVVYATLMEIPQDEYVIAHIQGRNVQHQAQLHRAIGRAAAAWGQVGA